MERHAVAADSCDIDFNHARTLRASPLPACDARPRKVVQLSA
jgi:hypothetical protein